MTHSRVLWLLGLAYLLACAGAQADAYKYARGTNINLCFNHAVATCTAGGTNPSYPLYGAPDSRYIKIPNGQTSCWWQVEFCNVFKVDRYIVDFYAPPYSTTNFAIRTSLDGVTWTTQASYNEAPRNPSTFQGTFAGGAVDAKFVRIEIYGYESSSYGAIVNRVRLYGPNDPEVNANISLAQKEWNDSFTSNENGSEGTLDGNANQGYFSALTNGLPLKFDLTLDHKVQIRTLAFCSYVDTRTAKDIDVYGWQGGGWVKIKEVRGLTLSPLPQEFTLDTPIFTDNLRYQLLSNYGASTIILMEVMVYGVPPPKGAAILIR